MRYSKTYIEMRIAKLQGNPIANANLIRKWQRALRKVESNV